MDDATALRCAHCGAGLVPDSPWCSLCFTPVPVAAPVIAAPVPEPAVVVEHHDPVADVGIAAGHPLYPHITPQTFDRPASTGRHARPPQDDGFRLRPAAAAVPQPRLVAAPAAAPPVAPPVAAPAAPAAPAVADVPAARTGAGPAPAWPCGRCGARVPIELDTCPDCGGGFMQGGGGTLPTLVLPVIGDVSSRSQGQRYAIAGGVGLVAALLFVGLVALLSAVL